MRKKQITKTVWEAEDGTRFDDPKSCQEYEQGQENMQRRKLLRYFRVEHGLGKRTYIAVEPWHDDNAYTIIKDWCENRLGNRLISINNGESFGFRWGFKEISKKEFDNRHGIRFAKDYDPNILSGSDHETEFDVVFMTDNGPLPGLPDPQPLTMMGLK